MYIALGERAFRRARVELVRVAGREAVLARGPEPGARLVVQAAAELYGTEFGVGK